MCRIHQILIFKTFRTGLPKIRTFDFLKNHIFAFEGEGRVSKYLIRTRPMFDVPKRFVCESLSLEIRPHKNLRKLTTLRTLCTHIWTFFKICNFLKNWRASTRKWTDKMLTKIKISSFEPSVPNFSSLRQKSIKIWGVKASLPDTIVYCLTFWLCREGFC